MRNGHPTQTHRASTESSLPVENYRIALAGAEISSRTNLTGQWGRANAAPFDFQGVSFLHERLHALLPMPLGLRGPSPYAVGRLLSLRLAALPACLVRSATQLMEFIHRRCRPALSKTRAREKAPAFRGALCNTSRISDQQGQTPARPRRGSTSTTVAMQYNQVRRKHCCCGIAGSPLRVPCVRGARRRLPSEPLLRQSVLRQEF